MAVMELRKRYGRTVALDRVGFDVRAGEVFGPLHLVTMVAWTLVATAVAARTLRWE